MRISVKQDSLRAAGSSLVEAEGARADIIDLIMVLSRTDALRQQWVVCGSNENVVLCWPVGRA